MAIRTQWTIPPPGHRRPWDEAADRELGERIGAGELLPQLARAMGRTQEACRSRANILGLPVRSSLRAPTHPRGPAPKPEDQPR